MQITYKRHINSDFVLISSHENVTKTFEEPLNLNIFENNELLKYIRCVNFSKNPSDISRL